MTSEKEIHAKIRRELETSQRNCAHLEEDLELARQETKTRSSELENCKKRELQYKTQLDKTLEEQKQLRQTKDALKREVEERSAKDPVQMEEMKVKSVRSVFGVENDLFLVVCRHWNGS